MNESRLTDVSAEDAVVGILVLQWHRLNTDDVSEFMALKPEHFWSPEARSAFIAIQFLWSAGREIDVLNIVHAERELGLQPLAAYTTRLATNDTYFTRSEYGTLIERVRDAFNRRTLSNSARAALNALDEGVSTAEVSESILGAVSCVQGDTSGPVHIAIALDDELKLCQEKAERLAKGERPRYPSSLLELNEVFEYEPGTMTVIAGRPGMGKTAFMLQECISFGRAGRKGVIFSIEMSKGKCAIRCTGITSGVNVSEVIKGRISDIKKLQHGIRTVSALPIHIHDASFIRVEDIARLCRILHSQGKLEFFAVDYVGIVKPSNIHGKNGNREQEVAHISGTLRGIARELNVPCLALAQMNRESERRDRKRPGLSDLRESGSLEQDADNVLFPFRPGKYDEKLGDAALIVVAKYRNGACQDVDCRWSGPRMCYVSLHDTDDEEPPVY